MLGFVGIAKARERADELLLDRMIESMIHEHWYKIDKFLKDEFALARVHLGILNPESQPIYNEDKSLCIFMDGEVSDYKKDKEELRQKGHKFYVNNDPEFCLHLYEEYGEKFVEKLNGSFTIAILDIKNQRLLIANDRYGLRPLYFYKNNGRFLFASEVKAILEDNEFKREINDDAVAEFFTFGYLLGNKTFLKGIEVLPPASVLKWERGGMVVEQYWEFRYDETAQKYTEGYYVEELVKLFKQAVERRMKGNYRLGIYLSGGMDSRAVVAASDKKYYPLTTITFAFPGNDSTPKIAKKVAEIKGTDHREFSVNSNFLIEYAKKGVYFTDGMLPITQYLDLPFLDEFHGCCDIVFDGYAFDALLGGSYLDKKILSANNDEKLSKILYKKHTIISEEIKSNFFSEEYYNKIKGLSSKTFDDELNKTNVQHPGNKSDWFLFQNHVRRSTVFGLVIVRCKLENKVPTYDSDLVDFILKIPPNLRYNHQIYIKFFKMLASDLSKIPINNNNIRADAPPIFYKLFSLKKMGTIKIKRIIRDFTHGLINLHIKSDYPDYGQWARENKKLRKWVEDILLDERTLNREYFNGKFIVKMVRDHMSYKKDYTQLIFLLLTFELWYRIFIEEEGELA